MRCHTCGGRFGLIHHKSLTFNGYLRFCTKACKRAYEKRIADEVRRRKFFRWLHAESGTT
jgi:hypothetical protein